MLGIGVDGMIGIEKHLNCPVAIRFKNFKNRVESVPELYCVCHNKHIKWLTQQDADYLMASGVTTTGLK